MFDGGHSLTIKTVVYRPREGLPPVKVIYTGHPPPAQQIAGQVRSGTGMTFGRPTHDGPKMHPGFTSQLLRRDTLQSIWPVAPDGEPKR